MVLWRKTLGKIYVVDLGETLNKLFFHEIVRVLKFLIQDLTCCKIFVVKSDTF